MGGEGAVVRLEAAEVRGVRVPVIEDVGAPDVLLIPVVIGPAAAGVDVALDAEIRCPFCKFVHNTGFCPSCSTMLKSLLVNVGGVALEVLRSATSKWHTQAFPSSRGTRAEPVADTDWLYAGRKR